MTAKTPDGKEIFQESRIYMPIPGRMGRGDKMGRGPYEKSSILRDTALPPLRTVKEKFIIPYPYKDEKKGKKRVRKILSHDMNVDVALWYLPFGSRKDEPFLFRKVTKKISIEKDEKRK